jgi:hypothetical protein
MEADPHVQTPSTPKYLNIYKNTDIKVIKYTSPTKDNARLKATTIVYSVPF